MEEKKENKFSALEQAVNLPGGTERAAEAREAPRPEEDIVRKELMREIDEMNLDEGLKQEAELKAKKVQQLGDEQKLKHLLEIARKKGVIFAVNVAKKMGDPYILDTFHDLLAKEGLYAKYIK